jgi:hypothetical protein
MLKACPDPSEYQRLAAGQMPAEQQEDLLRHLESCEACGHRLDALAPDLTLAELGKRA